MNIPRAIKACRLARGLTQSGLAARAEISPSYLSLLESGKKNPSLQLVHAIADALDLSVDVLMLMAIDYVELRKMSNEVVGLFGQMLETLAEGSSAQGAV